jgi:CRP/FNR family cyclic AMP-dependent transcriptional regulator
MDSTASIAAMLAGSALFGGLDDGDRRRVAEAMRRVTFEPRQMIFSRGDTGSDVFLVLEGRVRLSVLTGDGRELSLAHATTGDIFGEIAALDGGERTAGATAITAVKAMALGRRQLLELVDTRPSVARAALQFLCTRLRDTDHKLEGIALHSIEVRLARFFLSLVKRDAEPAKNGQLPVDLAISQGEIALLIGASRPKVNLALTTLEEMGGISRVGSAYSCDPDVLEGIAEGE